LKRRCFRIQLVQRVGPYVRRRHLGDVMQPWPNRGSFKTPVVAMACVQGQSRQMPIINKHRWKCLPVAPLWCHFGARHRRIRRMASQTPVGPGPNHIIRHRFQCLAIKGGTPGPCAAQRDLQLVVDLLSRRHAVATLPLTSQLDA